MGDPPRKRIKLAATIAGVHVEKQVAIEDAGDKHAIKQAWEKFAQSCTSLTEARSWRYLQNGKHLTKADKSRGGSSTASQLPENISARATIQAALRRLTKIIALPSSRFLGKEKAYQAADVDCVKKSLKILLKPAMEIVEELHQFDGVRAFLSCGSLLSFQRQEWIERDDDIDFSAPCDHDKFENAVAHVYAQRLKWERSLGVRVLLLGTNDKQLTVKIVGHVQPQVSLSGEALRMSDRWLMEHATTYTNDGRSLNLVRLNVEAAEAKHANVRGKEVISVQVVDINLCKMRAKDGVWQERPFKSTFRFTTFPPPLMVTGVFLGVAVPLLPQSERVCWLRAAYGGSWATPLHKNLFPTKP